MEENTFNKKRTIFFVLLIVFVVLLLDQWLKIYIKTNFTLGQSVTLFPNWFELHFTENPGMAFGLTLGGKWGKIVLTLFRVLASGLIIYYIGSLIKEKAKSGLIILVALILAGALGNIIDSLFYGMVLVLALTMKSQHIFHQMADMHLCLWGRL